MTIYSLSIFNPDWQIIVYYPPQPCKLETWATKEQKHQPYNGEDYFPLLYNLCNVEILPFAFGEIGEVKVNNEKPEIYKSDLLRLYLLGYCGGVWSDIDILYIRPLEQFCFNRESSDVNAVCCYREPAVHVYNSIGLLMAGGNGKLLFSDLLFWALEKYETNKSYQGLGSELYNDYFKLYNIFPFVKTRDKVEEHYRKDGVVLANLPYQTIYLNRNKGLMHFYKPSSFEIEKERIGIHWYSGHEISARWENIITKENIIDHQKLFLFKLMQRVKNDQIQYPHALSQKSRASA